MPSPQSTLKAYGPWPPDSSNGQVKVLLGGGCSAAVVAGQGYKIAKGREVGIVIVDEDMIAIGASLVKDIVLDGRQVVDTREKTNLKCKTTPLTFDSSHHDAVVIYLYQKVASTESTHRDG